MRLNLILSVPLNPISKANSNSKSKLLPPGPSDGLCPNPRGFLSSVTPKSHLRRRPDLHGEGLRLRLVQLLKGCVRVAVVSLEGADHVLPLEVPAGKDLVELTEGEGRQAGREDKL